MFAVDAIRNPLHTRHTGTEY